jgi:hypothetical protein
LPPAAGGVFAKDVMGGRHRPTQSEAEVPCGSLSLMNELE